MKPWMHAVIYQTTWFITVLAGNLWSLLWALPLLSTIVWRQAPMALAFIGLVTVLGYGADLTLQAVGLVTFNENSLLGPLWLLVLWVSFANVIWHLLHKIPGLLLPALLGAISGPLSYYGGAVLGAAEPLSTAGIIAFSIWWAVAFPAFITLRRHWPPNLRRQIKRI
ncbi:MAG: DUF2878 domain-containing protein [Natronospirillum sp.]|nr:DUF2878 domain-containing protein [Natronospirillum sp.]